ncbi:hypothetical protein [Solidesulfovibrio sp.]|uniref:hypothetical protein n=1 Tax=Solidesulfovibrio sp. TaxID=2910990 RepID=UPI00262C217D|nr:hypothetical protein [Solidesulfovibrio sp.]
MTATGPGLSPGERFDRDMAVLRRGGLPWNGRRAAPLPVAPYRPRTGDVVLRLLAMPESIGLAATNLSGYSHCGVVRETGGHAFVVDCYPPINGHPGGVRRTPFAAWTAAEAGVPVLHWQALRRPDMDADAAGGVLDALACRELRFSLVLEGHDALADGIGEEANCSALARAFLEAMGTDCATAFAATAVTTRVMTRFFFLAENGFYDAAPGGAGRDFYDLAQAHGLTALAAYPRATMPPGFGELLPELAPVGYGQGQAVPRAMRRFALAAYARMVPMVRAAVACHGVLPETALAWLDGSDDWGLASLVRALPGDVPVKGTTLAVEALLALADTPAPYVTIPLAVHFAFGRPGPLLELAQAAALRAAPPLAALARRTGLGPFRLFDAAPEPQGTP